MYKGRKEVCLGKRIKVLQLKILLVILEIMLVLLIWTLLQVALWNGEDVVEHIRTKNPQTTQEPLPTSIPFVLRNYDKIRVVITNKETGSIYHDEIKNWQNGTDYRGEIEILKEAEGYVVINELPVEEYLYSVVPSEMPASYPMEALKAQAICARTYAYLHIMSPGYPKWNAHVDDTTAYQVYHSVKECETTTRAVNETQGLVLLEPNEEGLAQTYYYSTSCGYGSDAHVWRSSYSDSYPYIKSKHINRFDLIQEAVSVEDFEQYITKVHAEDYEASQGWYRWKYRVEDLDREHLLSCLQKRYRANEKLVLTKVGDDYISQPIEEIGNVTNLIITQRQAGGVADEMLIYTDTAVYKVITELNIRYVLNDGCSLIERQDGVKVEMYSLLPSAFFIINLIREDEYVAGYEIIGGGFGHGAGMSQNAAKAMAEDGMTAQEILTFFFENCTVKNSKG